VFKSGDSLRTITEGLGWLQQTCKLQGMVKLLHNHVLAQRFFCRFLNSAYRLQLRQTDHIQSNYPAIDLGDTTNKVAYQITADKGSDKVQHTLDKFVEHGLEKSYNTLRILIIGERQKAYATLVVPPLLQFDRTRDIIGIPELIKYIEKLDTNQLDELSKVVTEELTFRDHTPPRLSRARFVLGLVPFVLCFGVLIALMWISPFPVHPPKARLSLGPELRGSLR